jgi:hypothetical protein
VAEAAEVKCIWCGKEVEKTPHWERWSTLFPGQPSAKMHDSCFDLVWKIALHMMDSVELHERVCEEIELKEEEGEGG